MRIRFYSLCATVALAGLAMSGCVERQPVYTSPPPVAGTYTPPPQPAPAPAPGVVQEPPEGVAAETSVPPPTPPAEVAPPAPGPDFAWTPGYWNWNGVGWVWAPGIWVRPPYRGAVWFGGRWAYRGGRHVWVRGRWR